MAKVSDLKAEDFPALEWETKEIAGYLDKLYQHVVAKARAAQEWYFHKRSKKRLLGLLLRVVAIVVATAAGIFPVLSEMFEKNDGTPYVPPGLASILFALAGLCILLDKFGGYTSGWVRYVLTGQQIGQQLDEFQFAWQRTKLGLSGHTPTYDEARQLLTVCYEFASKVSALVADETKEWAAEFENALKMIDAAAKEIPKREATGAVDVKVANGEKSDGGWKLQIDESLQKVHVGNRAAIRALRPGLHFIRVTGVIDEKHVSDERSAKVIGGEIVEIEMELKEPS